MPAFDLCVSSLEDGMVNALTEALEYPAQVLTYGGQLDADNLRAALDDLIPLFPLFLISYGEGKDVEHPPTAPVPPTLPRFFIHRCTFAVYCVGDDARSEATRRAGVYKQIADCRDTLSGLQVKVVQGAETILINPEPFKPAGVEYIARLPELTAYAVLFDTYFRYTTPDRTTSGPLVQELVIDIENTYPKTYTGQLPGVVLKDSGAA